MSTQTETTNFNKKSTSFFKGLTPFRHSTDSKSNEVSNVAKRYNEEKLITPELAREYFQKNIISNRFLRDKKVTQFAKDIVEGKWKRHTAETIKFNTKGIIIDGQHRLAAIIKADRSVWIECAFNVPDENFDVLDSGTPRSSADIFKIEGIKNSNLIPSMIQQYYVLMNGGLSSNGISKNKTLTNSGLLQKYYSNEEYWQNLTKQTIIWYNSFSRILRPSLIGGLFAYLETIDENKAFIFFEQLTKHGSVDHPAIGMLHDKLVQDRMSNRRMTGYTVFGLIIKAWNYYRSNTICKRLVFDPEKENMPTVK